VESSDAPGYRTCRRLRVERQDLPQPLEGRVRHYRQSLEWTAVLWAARQAIEDARDMKTVPKSVRCAIYTRKSTEQGLEQDFNSLDAQYEASQAYIRSQAHAGWTLLRAKYDDGGFSGGDTDRPALQRLLEDVQAGKIDVIVVYKVDRLTRSLADFAKLVELFDQHSVSFVSVTQQFNTTTSMGRLTLNVLLSFAQFEREVTSERIRDKISASKRKGLWVGGMAPLGYDTKDRRITVNQAEADRVRTIFRRYVELGSLNLLMADLRERGIVTKVRNLRSGEKIGGIPFTRGPLAHLLRNRFYIGEVTFKGEVLKGEQKPIVDNELFEAVQTKLTEQANNHKANRTNSGALLTGRIFDDRGNRMTPSHARKGGIKYRYYLSSALLHGAANRAGSVSRVPAAEIEALVIRTLREHLDPMSPIDDRDLINDFVARVEIQQERLVIQLADASGKDSHEGIGDAFLRVPWQKPNATRRREVILPEGAELPRPMRSENRATLVASIARGRRWLDELIRDPKATSESIAKRESCSVRKVNMTISLVFLAPSLVKDAIEGRLPHGIGVARLIDLPADWSRQYAILGFSMQ
jgi:site-specific DNA recombinase